MPDPHAGLAPRYLRAPKAARLPHLVRPDAGKAPHLWHGPTYRKLGSRVVYAQEDRQAFELGTKTSTSNSGAGTVLPAKRHARFPRGAAGGVRNAISSLSQQPQSRSGCGN